MTSNNLTRTTLQKSAPTPSGMGYRPGQMRSPSTPYSGDYRRAMAYPVMQSDTMTSDNVYAEPGSPTSPDPKRRRVGHSPHSPTRVQQPSRAPIIPPRQQEILHRPNFIERRTTAAAPVQRPFHQRAQHVPTPLHLKKDSAERLPGLKTGNALDGLAQNFSVDAMVNSKQSVNKVKLLAKISPSLPTPGTASPPFAVRGAIIAVDGAENEAVKRVTEYLHDFLAKDKEYKIQIWNGSPPVDKAANFSEYLRLIRDWHWKSQQIVHHITTLAYPRSPTPVSPRTVPSSRITASVERISPSRLETLARNAKHSASEESEATKSPHASRETSFSSTPSPVPIALVPHFQLSQTDFFASRIPISDSYAPIDHWQWMATLWRGVVGPDITIVVKPALNVELQTTESGKKDEVDSSKEMLSNGSVTGDDTKHPCPASAASTRPGMRKIGVELRLQDARTIIMRSIDDKDLRRVAFEVGEWVRDKV